MIKNAIALLLLFAVGTLFASLLAGYVPDSELNQTARYYAERTASDIGAANIVTPRCARSSSKISAGSKPPDSGVTLSPPWATCGSM